MSSHWEYITGLGHSEHERVSITYNICKFTGKRLGISRMGHLSRKLALIAKDSPNFDDSLRPFYRVAYNRSSYPFGYLI